MPPGLTIPSIFTAVDRFSRPLMAMRGAMASFVSRAEIGLARVERGFRRMISPILGIQNMLRGVGLYIGLFTAIMIFRSAVDTMADFEQAQVNISAVNGKTLSQNKAMADQARVLALRYGEAAKSILELDLALIKLGFSEADVMKMAKPIMTGAVALKAIPEELAKTVGATLQAFKLPSSEAQNVVDMMAKAADLSALDWSDIQTMLPRAMQSASLAGMDLPQLLSLFAMARNAQVHVASGSTAIKNMLIKGAIWNKDFNTMLQNIIDSPDSIKKAYKMFGSKTLVTALPLSEAQKLGDIDAFRKQLMETFSGYAERVASLRLDSTRGRITLFKRAWEELILSIDDGTGPVGSAIKRYLDIGRSMLLLAADSDVARGALNEMDKAVVDTARKYLGWLKILGYITGAFIAMRVALFVWAAALTACKIVLFAWNVVLGISAALGWANVMSLRGNVVALAVLRGAIAVATAAQWLWNVALTANPIGLIIVGIAALIGLIAAVVIKWDEWGASIAAILGPFGGVITMIMTIFNNWSKVVDAFSGGGIIEGLKAIGKAMFDMFLYPLQQAYELLAKIPGFSELSSVARLIEAYRGQMWSTNGATSQAATVTPPILSPSYATGGGDADAVDFMKRIGLDVNINNRTGFDANVRGMGLNIINKPQSTFE
jgi:hypothetical protein